MRPLAFRLVPLGLVALGVCAAASVALPGCSLAEYDSVNPVELPTPTTGSGAASSGGSGPVEPRVRTVGVRNPWGNVPGNLLLDGDFELSAGATGANLPGWWAFRYGSGDSSIVFETGGLCRHGLSCAVAERGMAFVGWGVAANGTAMLASLWAKVPPERGCEVVQPALILWSNGTGSYLNAVPAEPNADGWCRYEAAVGERDSATLMYIETTLQGDEKALLDDARVVPSSGVTPMSGGVSPQSAAHRTRAKAALDWIRARRPFGRPPSQEPRRPID